MAELTKVKILKHGYSFVAGDTVGVSQHTADKLVAAGVAEIVGKSTTKGSTKKKEGDAKENKALKKKDVKTK